MAVKSAIRNACAIESGNDFTHRDARQSVNSSLRGAFSLTQVPRQLLQPNKIARGVDCYTEAALARTTLTTKLGYRAGSNCGFG